MVTDFLYRKTMPRSVVPQVRVGISTQSYSNFGLGGAVAALGRCRWSAADVGTRVLAAVRLLTLQQVGLWLLR